MTHLIALPLLLMIVSISIVYGCSSIPPKTVYRYLLFSVVGTLVGVFGLQFSDRYFIQRDLPPNVPPSIWEFVLASIVCTIVLRVLIEEIFPRYVWGEEVDKA